MHRHGGFFFCMVLCVVMGVALTFFYLYHCNLVRQGCTTNEKMKLGYYWSRIDYGIHSRKKKIEALGKEIDQKEKGQDNKNKVNDKGKNDKTGAEGEKDCDSKDGVDNSDNDSMECDKKSNLTELNEELITLYEKKQVLLNIKFSRGFLRDMMAIYKA